MITPVSHFNANSSSLATEWGCFPVNASESQCNPCYSKEEDDESFGVQYERKGEITEDVLGEPPNEFGFLNIGEEVGSQLKVAEIYFNLGNSYSKKGDLKRAIRSYELCIQHDASNRKACKRRNSCAHKHTESSINLNLGKIKFAQGDVQSAINFFMLSKELDPSNVEAWVKLGLIYLSRADFESSIQCNKRAISFDPTNEEAYYNLGRCLQETEKLREAALMYKSVLGINGENKHAFYYLGEIYRQLGEAEEAFHCYTKALLIDPSFPEAQKAVEPFVEKNMNLLEQAPLEESKITSQFHFKFPVTWGKK